jgi:hypothetical protein
MNREAPHSFSRNRALPNFALRLVWALGFVSILLSTAVAGAQPAAAGKLITYSTQRRSVQYIVIDLAKQVGLGYNWDKSFAQTNPQCRRYADNVSIQDQSFDKAMARILGPLRLRYQVEGDKVVLYRR